MKTTKFLAILVTALGLLTYSAQLASAEPMGTAFTYQGHLYDASYAANGSYDFAFKLYDANAGGNKVGTDVNVADVDVIDAYFTVELNFGVGVFDGDKRWLEIGIRPGDMDDPNVYTTLDPRQELTPTPYGIHAQHSEYANDADSLDGHDSIDFASNIHTHSGSDIISGIVNQNYIDSLIARDSEIMPQVLANDGSGSTLDADLLDGYNSSSFVLTNQDYGRSGVSSNLYEGTTALSNKYVNEGQASSVSSAMIVNETITSADIASNAVTASEIAANAVGSSEIANGSVTASDMADGAALSEILDDDGPGSGLNADLLDGSHASSFASSSHSHHSLNAADGSPINALYVNNDGHVGIGTTDPEYADLQVHSAGGTVKITNTGTGTGFTDGLQIGFFSTGSTNAIFWNRENADIRFATNNTERMRITDTGRVGIGTRIPPNAMLDVGSNIINFKAIAGTSSANNSIGVYGQSDGSDGIGTYGYATGTNGIGVYADASGSNGVGVKSWGLTYDFYAFGPGTNYGPFTGGHEVKLSDDFSKNVEPGLIVSVTGQTQMRYNENGEVSLSSTLPTVALSNAANDKAVLGVFVAEVSLPKDHWYKAQETERFATVNALGEGRVWVCNINGEIEAGDYITTSSVPGYGEKQYDNLLRSCTVGKAIETVDWDSITDTIEFNGKIYKRYLIAVVYTSG